MGIRWCWWLGVVLCTLCLIGFYIFWPSQQMYHASVFDTPRQIRPFSLIAMTGKPFTLQQLKGHWHWIFFGFTRCPQLCPDTLVKLAKAYQGLEKKGVHPLPQVILISIDPQHDSSMRIKQYVQAFHHHFYGVTGQAKEIATLARQFGVYYETANLQAHSGAIIVVDPKGEWRGLFNSPFSVHDLIHDHQVFIRLR